VAAAVVVVCGVCVCLCGGGGAAAAAGWIIALLDVLFLSAPCGVSRVSRFDLI
jgi:hypothetical protein